MKSLKTLAFAAIALSSSTAFAGSGYTAGKYTLDTAHSKVGFEVPHLVVSTVEGRFNAYEGELSLAPKFQDSKLSISIDAKSIDTGIEKRDGHLRSPDFFDVAKYPKLTFKSKRIEGTPESFKVIGDLTIKNVTKEVALDGKYLGSVNDGYGNLKAAFQASGKISRKAYGLLWNNMVEAGPVAGDEISIALKAEAGKPDEKAAK